MKLPAEIEHRVLELIGMPELNWKSVRAYNKKLNQIRKQMYKLADNFAQAVPSAGRYSDAYFAYNFPMNLMKAIFVMNEIQKLYPQLFKHKKKMNILDIGCGEGAGMLGLYYALNNKMEFVLVGIDTSIKMLKRCREMVHWLKDKDTHVRITLRRRDMSEGLLKKKIQKYDIAILANSLSEILMYHVIPVRYIERIFKSVKDDGIVIIIEPALKHLSRRLMVLRNEIIQKHKGYILIPCLHKNECPLYEIRKQKEWCHQSISWKPPDYLKILNQGLNREIDYLKFSYLVISKIYHKKKCNECYLVISPLLREKGKKKCFLCTPYDRIELVRLNRYRNKLNSAFDKIRKGNIVSLSDYIQENERYWQITGNTKIKILFK